MGTLKSVEVETLVYYVYFGGIVYYIYFGGIVGVGIDMFEVKS